MGFSLFGKIACILFESFGRSQNCNSFDVEWHVGLVREN